MTFRFASPLPLLALAAACAGLRADPALAQSPGTPPPAGPSAAPAPPDSASAGGRRPGRGGIFGRLEAVPPPPGTDPLSLATSRDSCTSDARTAAQPLVSAFRAYLTGYEAKQDPAEVPGLDIVPHTAGADPAVPYYLELRPQFARPAAGVAEGPPGAPRAPSPARAAFRAFAACAYITPLSPDAANAKGIDVSGRPRLLYVPKMGFAIVRPATAPPPGGGNPPA